MNDNIQFTQKELTHFIKWVTKQLETEKSTYKLKGYQIAGETIAHLAAKRYDELTIETEE